MAVERLPGRHYSVHEDTMSALAEAVRTLRQSDTEMTIGDMTELITDLWLGHGDKVDMADTVTPWVRPSAWPDLDAIEIAPDFDGVYLTYDLTKTAGYGWIGVRVAMPSSGTLYVDRGHLDDNNEFVSDAQYTATGTTVDFRRNLDAEDGNVQLWRVTASKNIIGFRFCSKTTSNTTSIAAKIQPCVEATGQLLYVTSLGSDALDYRYNYYAYTTCWMERDSRAVKGPITSLKNAWGQAYRLQSIDFSKWDTSNAVVTSLESAFAQCVMLHDLDLSPWDTSGWAVTTMASCFYQCFSLRSINFTGWDTSEWAVTTMASCFSNCRSLLRLNLNGWDTSNWRVTTLTSCWDACNKLVSLNVSEWDTSEWAVTSLHGTFKSCMSLMTLEAAAWDTSNWAVTTLKETFRQCYNLRTLGDALKWDTSGWAVTTMECTFYACYGLTSLAFKWDTSSWAVTTLNGTFEYCISLRTLDVSEWDTSNWAVTDAQYLFAYLYSLPVLDVSDWDTTGWTLSGNAVRYLFTDSHGLQQIIGFDDWPVDGATNYTLPSGRMLTYYGGIPVKIAHNVGAFNLLTVESLVDMFTALPTLTAAKTLTIGPGNAHKLTAEQKAIATGKGWTLA